MSVCLFKMDVDVYIKVYVVIHPCIHIYICMILCVPVHCTVPLVRVISYHLVCSCIVLHEDRHHDKTDVVLMSNSVTVCLSMQKFLHLHDMCSCVPAHRTSRSYCIVLDGHGM